MHRYRSPTRGAIVVVSLIFLVIQLRQNTRALKSRTVLGQQRHTLTGYQTLMEDSMMEVILKGMPRPSDLTPAERDRFNAFWTMALQNYQHGILKFAPVPMTKHCWTVGARCLEIIFCHLVFGSTGNRGNSFSTPSF